MAWLRRDYDEDTAAYRMQRAASERLAQTTIAQVFDHGLHEFIADFIVTNRHIADAVAADYRFTE